MDEQELLGFAETAELLGLSKQALRWRSEQADFPEPLFRLAATPVWTRAAIVDYARLRNETFYERPGVRKLAESEEQR